jgi:hypothetical protein
MSADPWARRLLDSAGDACLAAVGAFLHDDRDLVVEVVDSWLSEQLGAPPDPQVLAFALTAVELTANVHRRWARGVGLSADQMVEGWQAMMVDLAAERG